MIKYSLRCGKGDQFEAWFANSSAYDRQSAARQIVCPQCGSDQVEKALMAPNIVSSSSSKDVVPVPAVPSPAHVEAVALLRKLREHVQQNSEYVGRRFAEEALKIHHEEIEARNIYGEASEPEVETLRDEGVEFYPLPVLPEEHN
jgi:hypothetical protein